MRSRWLFERPKVSWDASRRDDIAPDLYRILGLHGRASERKIKATYRKLAKRLHPDVNASETATKRLIEINGAYQILGDPDAREAYDAELALERSEARGRFWRGVAAGIGTFILTVSSVFLAALLFLYSPAPRPGGEGAVPAENQSVASKFPERDGARSGGWAKPGLSNSVVPEKPAPTPSSAPEATSQQPLQEVASAGEVGHVGSPDEKARTSNEPAEQPRPRLVPTPREVVASAPSDVPPVEETPPVTTEDKLPRGVENLAPPRIGDKLHPPTAQTVQRAEPSLWRLYLNAGSGFSLKYPADVFPSVRTNENKDRLLTTKDRRAVLHIFSMTNGATTFPAYRQSLMAQRYAGASFDYTPQRGNWFVLSGAIGDEIFYERVSLSCDRRSIHGWVLAYPRGERAFYDTILAGIRSSYRHANALCGDLKS